MRKNYKLASKVDWKALRFKDPRILMRAIIGALLLANLAMAVVAFKPFGGSADDLRQDQQRRSAQLRQMETRLDAARRLKEKVDIARTQGDEFLAKYIMDTRTMAEIALAEMTKAAADAGMRPLPSTYKPDAIEGSDTLQRLSIEQGFEGPYANLAKLVNLLEKSPRFLILDSMALNAPQTGPQGGQPMLNVTLKVIVFVKDDPGAAL